MSKRILIVEDYDDARRLYKKMLEELGFSVTEAEDGYEALEQFNKHPPNLVLMDMAMPGMDGLAATRRIRGLKETANVPIIGITAHGNFYNHRALEAGCDTVVSKPIDLDNFNNVISLYLLR